MPHDSDVWSPPEGGGPGVSEHQPSAFQLRFQNKAVIVGKDGSNAQLAASSSQWASGASKSAHKTPATSAHLTGMKRAMIVNHAQRGRGGGTLAPGRGGGPFIAPPALAIASPRDDVVPEAGMGAAIKKFGIMTPAQERRQHNKLIAAQLASASASAPSAPPPPSGMPYARHPARIEPSRVDVGLDFIPNEHPLTEGGVTHQRGMVGHRGGAHPAPSPPSSARSPSSSQYYLGAMEDHIQHIKTALNPTHVARSASPPQTRLRASAQSSSCGSFTHSPPRAERPPHSSPAPPRMHGQARKPGPPGQRLTPLAQAGQPNEKVEMAQEQHQSGIRAKEAWLPAFAETASDVDELEDSTIVIEACEEVLPSTSISERVRGAEGRTNDIKKRAAVNAEGGPKKERGGPMKQEPTVAPRVKQPAPSPQPSSMASRQPAMEKGKSMNTPQPESAPGRRNSNTKPFIKKSKNSVVDANMAKAPTTSISRDRPGMVSNGPQPYTKRSDTGKHAGPSTRQIQQDDEEDDEWDDDDEEDEWDGDDEEEDDTGEEKSKRIRRRSRNRRLGEKGKFVPYSIDAYRSMMKEVRQQKLGGLGPSDTDAQRAAREKLEKQKSYGARVERETLLALEKARLQQERIKNTEAQESSATRGGDNENNGADSKHTSPKRSAQRDAEGHLIIAQPTPPDIIEARQRRERAKQYAMKVPKPQVKARPPPLNHAEEDAIDGLLEEAHMKGTTSPRGQVAQQRAQRLADLEAKHQLYQKNVDHIRKQLRA